ncbi:hypothetical protein B0H10DRAFT_1949099 [Mycena sp. CBHHK59/15]|nr:hypothetical protein B0H10DRAFT_1949099 [Mycena sp. CBHHK59/15]
MTIRRRGLHMEQRDKRKNGHMSTVSEVGKDTPFGFPVTDADGAGVVATAAIVIHGTTVPEIVLVAVEAGPPGIFITQVPSPSAPNAHDSTNSPPGKGGFRGNSTRLRQSERVWRAEDCLRGVGISDGNVAIDTGFNSGTKQPPFPDSANPEVGQERMTELLSKAQAVIGFLRDVEQFDLLFLKRRLQQVNRELRRPPRRLVTCTTVSVEKIMNNRKYLAAHA